MNRPAHSEDMLDAIVDAPLPSAAARNESLVTMRDAVSRKKRRKSVIHGAVALVVVACGGFALLVDRYAQPTGTSIQQEPTVASSPTYEVVSSQPSGFTTFRSETPAGVTMISSSAPTSPPVAKVDDAGLLAMFPDSASILIAGVNDQAPKLIIAHIADATTLAQQKARGIDQQ